uniref:hypothetical protein n=1 Tax=Algoriphagus mannitolivorans TaxID=226504 RepID=UPI0004251604|nr:hypothetical protein [Algoriphagus mannitolivorans]
MKKRDFLKNSALLLGSAVLPPFVSCSPRKPEETASPELLKNWAENFEFSTSNVHYPKSTEEVQNLVKNTPKLRVLGSPGIPSTGLPTARKA